MAGESVARRYARAIFDLANERGESLDAWLEGLRTIESIMAAPSVRPIIVSPKFAFATKRALVEDAIQGLPELQRNLLYLLIQRNRTDALGSLIREFRQMVLDHKGIAEATITTAVPIDDAESARVGAVLGRIVGKTIEIERRVDPTIIGGIVIRVGDKLINGSVAGRLDALREQLV